MRVRKQSDVLVVGAGPVGLFAALSLAERGLSVQVVDKDWRGATHSCALALHTGTLRQLDEYAVADELLDEGHRLTQVAFYDEESRIATLDYSKLDEPFPFLLIVPQSALERALVNALERKGVPVLWNHRTQHVEQSAGGVTATIARMDKQSAGYPIARTEWIVGKEYDTRADFVVGADGYDSFVRKQLEVRFEDLGSPETFVVFEFPHRLHWRHEARVVFHGDTTNVLWPVGPEVARWSFQIDPGSPPPERDRLQELIRERAPWFHTGSDDPIWATTVLFERKQATAFGHGRIWLAGDAAHITGPVGVQSMNVGLREAHDLAEHVSAAHKGGSLEVLVQYGAGRLREWHQLHDRDSLAPGPHCDPRLARFARAILPCVPASGDQLGELLGQVGLAYGRRLAS